jgi:hypothetical protein
MIFLGKNIKSLVSENVSETTLENLFEIIKHGSDGLKERVLGLRNLRLLDKNAYKELKTNLPYFFGSSFTDNKRELKNFIAISYFVMDIDGIESESELHEIKGKIICQEEVLACFLSPGGKGIKVLFQFKKPITNAAAYTNYYRSFVFNFAQKVGAANYVDKCTNDVSRVCFLSFDPAIYYNYHALKLEILNTYQQADVFNNINEALEEETSDMDENSVSKPKVAYVKSNETYKTILNKLGGKPINNTKNYFVPEQIEAKKVLIKEGIESYGYKVLEIVPVQYGVKYKVADNSSLADVNVYFGKKGFSVVITPKNGTDSQFSEVIKSIIIDTLNNDSNNHVLRVVA